MGDIQSATPQQAQLIANYFALPEGTYNITMSDDSLDMSGFSFAPRILSDETCLCQSHLTLTRLENGRTQTDFTGIECQNEELTEECLSPIQFNGLALKGNSTVALIAALRTFGFDPEIKPRHETKIEDLQEQLQGAE
jgi:hypothetical protein